MQIVPNNHLKKTNAQLCEFLLKHEIKSVSFAVITDKHNHVGILGTLNPKKVTAARSLIEQKELPSSLKDFDEAL